MTRGPWLALGSEDDRHLGARACAVRRCEVDYVQLPLDQVGFQRLHLERVVARSWDIGRDRVLARGKRGAVELAPREKDEVMRPTFAGDRQPQMHVLVCREARADVFDGLAADTVQRPLRPNAAEDRVRRRRLRNRGRD